ncbi:MAG: MTH1187 family thiamine-binding protein [Candidatus Aminicenantales bacterium]
MVIAEFAIFPTSEGPSVSRYVKEAVKVIEESGLKNETGGMSTTLEAPDLRTLFQVIEKAHDVLVRMGVKRIHIDLRVDHRLDKKASIASKLKAIGKR